MTVRTSAGANPTDGAGLQWAHDFAKQHAKHLSLSEFGADADHFAPEVAKLLAWAKANGVASIYWWDRAEVINCRISDGSLSAVGAAVKAAL